MGRLQYLQGWHLSDRLPAGSPEPYAGAVLEVLRQDKGVACGRGYISARKQCQVGRGKAASGRSVRQGRSRTGGGGRRASVPPNHVKLAAMLAGATIAGGAVGAFAATWMSEQGAKRQAQAARTEADDRLKQETSKLRQEAQVEADKLRQELETSQARATAAEDEAAQAKTAAGEAVKRSTAESQAKSEAAALKAQTEADDRIKTETAKIRSEAEAQVAQAQADADRRLQAETQRIEQEAAARTAQIQAEADDRIKAEADRLASEAESRITQAQETAQQTAQASATEEVQRASTQIQAEADKRIAQVQSEADARVEEAIVRLTQETEDRIAQVQSEADARVRQETDRIQQEVGAQAEERIQVRGEELDRKSQQALQAKQRELQAEFDRKLQEATDRIQGEAIAQIATERESALKAAQDEIIAAAQPKARRAGELVDDDRAGIALSASVRQGLDLNTVSEANMQRRIDEATKRLAARRLQQGLSDLAVAFRDRTKEIQSLGGDRAPETGKAQQRRLQSRWEAMERSLVNQARRESYLADEVDEARKVAQQEYRDLLSELQAGARDRGGYEPELLEQFDRNSQRINQRLQKRISGALKEIDETIRLDRSEAYYRGVEVALRGDAWKLIDVAASPDRAAHKRRVWSGAGDVIRKGGQKIRREVDRITQTGQGREVDIKPVIEEALTSIASNVAPDWMSPAAAGATRIVTRAWRMTYEAARMEGLDGVFNRLRSMSAEDREEILSEGVVEFTTTALGEAVEREVSSTLPDAIEGVRSRRQRKEDSVASQFHQDLKRAIEERTGQAIKRLGVSAIQDDEVTGVFWVTGDEPAPQVFRLQQDADGVTIEVGVGDG